MKIIGITLREDLFKDYNEIRDCLDRRLIDFVLECGFLPILIPNMGIKATNNFLKNVKLDGIILSGGNTIENYSKETEYSSKYRDDFEINLVKYSMKTQLKLFGICRGMQVINFYFQGSLERLNNHVNTKHKIKVLDKKYKLPKEVNSFHNLGILRKDLNSMFDPIAIDEENNVESFKFKNYIFGIMWHPEREKPFSSLDLKLMKNFFND